MIGCSISSIIREVKRQGIGRKIGPVIVLNGDDVKRLRGTLPRGIGNPNFNEGNWMGKPPTKRQTKKREV